MNIIQIGSNDGNDHVFQFVDAHIDDINKILLIDASYQATQITERQYSKFDSNRWCIKNIAVLDSDESEISFFTPTCNPSHAHSSINRKHVSDHGHHHITEEKIKAEHINSVIYNFLKNENISILDRLYIDVEGKDIDLVNAINFELFNIQYLMFEFIHSDHTLSWGGEKLQICLERLKTFGYSIDKKEFNIIATR